MAGLSATGLINTQLEAVEENIPVAFESTNVLDKYIQDNGRAKRVSLKAYRVITETALPGNIEKVNLDSSTVGMPDGGFSEWKGGTVTPLAFAVPIEWTKLAELMNGGDVAVVNAVAHQMGKAMDRLKLGRDQFLQTDGTGTLASITVVNGTTLTLASSPFGSRLVEKNQKIAIFNGNALRGTCKVLSKIKALGATQQITVDVLPAGTSANDLIRVAGVEDGGPIFINGIPVFHSNARTGTVLNIDRSDPTNDFVIANSVDGAGGQITQPLLKLPFNQIIQELGEDGLKKVILHTHISQVASYEELGWQLQTYPLQGGQASGLDLFFTGKKTVEGRPIEQNIHADNSRWDYMNIAAWGKVKWGNPPFWFTQEGRKVFEIYGANGSPTAGARSFLVDCIQYYVDNFKSLASITNLARPANY